MEFSLIQPETDFDIKKYLGAVKAELELWGFEVSTQEKNKQSKSTIDSAFIKANTVIYLLKIDSNLKTHKNAVMKIKLEIDQDPATGFTSDPKYHLISRKIKEIDFSLAKSDVEPFLKNPGQGDELSLWSEAFFSDYLLQEIDVLTN